MPLYTHILTVELEDDTEAEIFGLQLSGWCELQAEEVERRWYRDLDAEAAAALVGVEWGGR